jgi:hypothetical protein
MQPRFCQWQTLTTTKSDINHLEVRHRQTDGLASMRNINGKDLTPYTPSGSSPNCAVHNG